MSKPAIIVEGIGKRYRLGHADTRHQTFREMATGLITAPLRRLRAAREGGAEGEDFWALKDINFEVRPGEVVGIIGRNGAGKSTLLKLLSRITEPTTGRIRLRGRVASLLEVGTGFHQELTGRENIYLNGAILGMKKAEIDKKFDEIVAFAETEKFLDTPVKRYSSGMYVRLAFAVAAHLEPEILIVDEVLSVGDAEFQKKCLGKMQEVSKGQGRAVLFVSHNMGTIKSLCGSACLLRKGQLAMQGSPEACIDSYISGSAVEASDGVVHFKKPPEGIIWMTEAKVGSDRGSNGKMEMGDKLWVEVKFEADKPVKHPRLGVVIFTPGTGALFQSHERFLGGQDHPVPLMAGTIRCELGQLPLVPGQYTIGLWLGDHMFGTHVEQDALHIDVLEHDIWGSGNIPTRSWAPLWWPAKFNYRA